MPDHGACTDEKAIGVLDPRDGIAVGVYDDAQLRKVVKRSNTGSIMWADTAYRSKKNETRLDKNDFASDFYQKKPKGLPMSEATTRANGRRSKIRSGIKHISLTRKLEWGCSSEPSAHKSDDEDRQGQSDLQHHPLRLA